MKKITCKLSTILMLLLIVQSVIVGQNHLQKAKSLKSLHSIFSSQKLFNNLNTLDPSGQIFQKNTDLLINQNAIKQKLDSVITESQEEYGKQWKRSSKEEYIYDISGNNIQYYVYEWHEINNHWFILYKTEFEYDNFNRMTLWLNYVLDWSTNQLEFSNKTEITYNNNGKTAQNIYSHWDPGMNKWYVDFKEEMTYNENGNISWSIYYVWDNLNNQWDNAWKSEYTYDNNGNIILETSYFWEDVGSLWLNDWKKETAYDNNGNLIQETNYMWNELEWEPNHKYHYTYNENNKLTSETSYWWISDWQISNKNDYSYDGSMNMILDTYLDLNETTNQLEAHFKQSYNYNNTYGFDELVLPWLLSIYDPSGMLFNHMITGSLTSDFIGDEWVDNEQHTFYYSETDINDITDHFIQSSIIFPNPTSGNTSISYTISNKSSVKLTIYNINGQEVKTLVNNIQQQGVHKVIFDTSDLPAGIYFCVLKTNPAHAGQTFKMIKL